LKNTKKPFGEGVSGVKKAHELYSTRWTFIGTIPIAILVVVLMTTSYLEEVIVPKIVKVKFIKPSAPSTPIMVPTPL